MKELVNKNQDIAIVILAAGASSRLGSPKQLLKNKNGETLIRNVLKIAVALSVPNVYVVLGAHHALIQENIENLDLEIIVNLSWREGISSSIQTAIKHIEKTNPDTTAVLFLVSDQPFLNKIILETIINKFRKGFKSIVASKYKDVMGTPAIFHKSFFNELKQLTGDKGAGKVIHANLEKTELVDFENGIIDIDTMQDYNLYLNNG